MKNRKAKWLTLLAAAVAAVTLLPSTVQAVDNTEYGRCIGYQGICIGQQIYAAGQLNQYYATDQNWTHWGEGLQNNSTQSGNQNENVQALVQNYWEGCETYVPYCHDSAENQNWRGCGSGYGCHGSYYR